MATLERWRKQFKIHVEFFKISVYHTSGKFKSSAKLTKRRILPVGRDTGGSFWDTNSHSGVDGGATVLRTLCTIKQTRNLCLNEKG